MPVSDLDDRTWLTSELVDFLARVSYSFQERVFGEQLARLNSLSPDARRAAYCAMMQHGLDHGVLVDRPADGPRDP
jgi:hypothetical protein